MIYDAARVRRLITKFQVNTSKNFENFILGGHFLGGVRGGGLDCGQYQILADPCNGLKNLRRYFGNDRFHRLGGD